MSKSLRTLMAFAATVVALSTSASLGAQERGRDQVHDRVAGHDRAQDHERLQLRERLEDAANDQERERIRNEHRGQMQERARANDIPLSELEADGRQ